MCALLFAPAPGASQATGVAPEANAEARVEMRKAFRDKGPVPGIEEDVAALAGGNARRAGPRLIERGPEVLPAVHAALLAPGVDPRHASRLLQLMGALAEESSVPVLLRFLRRDANHPLRRDALLVLALLPATQDAAAFVQELAAGSNEAWHTRRMAFTWFGLHRDPRGRPFAESMRADADPQHQAAALYVLARLGDATALDPISQMLARGAPANAVDSLLLALAELVSPGEFERRVPAALASRRIYKEALRYAQYRTAPIGERPVVCVDMLHARTPGHLAIAVRCLLDAGSAHTLRPYAAVDLEAPGRAALIRNEIRRAGWRVIDTDTEFRIERVGTASTPR